MSDGDRRYYCLSRVAVLLRRNDIFFVLSSGTLLGSVREGALISGDHDFDIEAKSEDADRILALSEDLSVHGIGLRLALTSPVDLFTGMRASHVSASRQIIRVLFDGTIVGDIFLFTCFSDGMYRRFDIENKFYVNPRHQIPAWYWEVTDTRALYGDNYPVPRSPELVLENMYGPRWTIPLKRGEHGAGAHRTGGAVVKRSIQPLIEHALEGGWDGDYSHCPVWPTEIRYVNSQRARRLLTWSEPESVHLTMRVRDGLEPLKVRVSQKSQSFPALKRSEIVLMTGAQLGVDAQLAVLGDIGLVERKLKRTQEKLRGLRKKYVATKRRSDKFVALRQRPIRSLCRFVVSKLTGSRQKWWRR